MKKEKDDKKIQERILEAARKEFSQHGFAGARMENIAKEAGANKALIFYYFTSKENLYRTILKGLFERMFPRVSELMESNPSPESFVEKMTVYYLDMFSYNPDLIKMIGLELILNPGNITSNLSSLFSEVAVEPPPVKVMRIIKQWADEGLITEKDPFQFMLNLVSLSLLSFIGKPFLEGMFQNSPYLVLQGEDFYANRLNSVINIIKRGMLT